MKKYLIPIFIILFSCSVFATNPPVGTPSQPAGVVLSGEFTNFWSSELIKNSEQHVGFMGGVYYNLTDKVTLLGIGNYGLNKVVADSTNQNAFTTEIKFGLLYDVYKIGRVTFAIGGEVGGSGIDLSSDDRGAISAFTKSGMIAVKTSVGPGEGVIYGRISQSPDYTKGFIGLGYSVPLTLKK